MEHSIHRLKENQKKEIGCLSTKIETSLNEKTKDNESLKKKMHNLKEDFSSYKSEMDKKCENLTHLLK